MKLEQIFDRTSAFLLIPTLALCTALARCTLDSRSLVGIRFAVPSAASGMGCYFVSIEGPEIPSTYREGDLESLSPACLRFGTVSGGVGLAAMQGAGVSLRVASGRNRTIRVFGVVPADGAACTTGDVRDLLRQAPAPQLYQLAHTTASLFRDTRLELASDDYRPSVTTPEDLVATCKGSSPGTGPGPGEEPGGETGPSTRVYVAHQSPPAFSVLTPTESGTLDMSYAQTGIGDAERFAFARGAGALFLSMSDGSPGILRLLLDAVGTVTATAQLMGTPEPVTAVVTNPTQTLLFGNILNSMKIMAYSTATLLPAPTLMVTGFGSPPPVMHLGVSPTLNILYAVFESGSTFWIVHMSFDSAGNLTQQGTINFGPTPGANPTQVAVSPSGNALYVGSSDGKLHVHPLNDITGAPSGSVATYPLSGPGPVRFTIDTARSMVFAVQPSASTLERYTYSPATSTLTAHPGGNPTVCTTPTAAAIHPGGGFLYLSSFSSGGVCQYSLDAQGTPTALSPQVVPTATTGTGNLSGARDITSITFSSSRRGRRPR